MPLIKNHKITVIAGISIQFLFVAAKFTAFIYSWVSLFFADAIDSFADAFLLVLLLTFLRFNLNNVLSLVVRDVLEASQWSAIIIFRVIVVMDCVNDLLFPVPRSHPLLVIIVASVVLVGSLVLAGLFVDEDDVVKFFLDPEELERAKASKKKQGGGGKNKKKGCCKILPLFAEALDNVATSALTLLVGLLMYFGVALDYLYIIDDGCNIILSIVMMIFAIRGLWNIAGHFAHDSFKPLLN